MKKLDATRFAHVMMTLAMVVLAADPVIWLIESWRDPSYDSSGVWVFLGCLLLAILSLRTPRRMRIPSERRTAIILLLATTALRALGEVLAIHVIGALALVVDIYALALMLGLKHRKFPLSPFWLAILFSLSLPLERLMQRMGGYGLQQLSASGACSLLQVMDGDVYCEGVRIFMQGVDVLVDLPCSGTRGMVLLATFFAALMSWARPGWRASISGVCLCVLLALCGNTLRISLLALGLAYPEWIGGIDVMTQPWHDLIGLFCLGMSAVPLVGFAHYAHTGNPYVHPVILQLRYGASRALKHDGWWLENPPQRPWRALASFGFLLTSLAIISLPGKPLDVSRTLSPLALPASIDGVVGIPIPLLQKEEDYFTRYGGEAEKKRYGTQQLLVIRTTSPLRHLHAPDECLRGQGYQVEYGGLSYSPVPTALYKVTTPDGGVWRVRVTFTDMSGRYYTSVAEAVWRWLGKPGGEWMAVQRISPWNMPQEQTLAWDKAVMATLDLSNSSTTLTMEP